MKFVVLGAGIAGLSVAHALRKRSYEPLVIASGHCATANGAGIVSSQFWQSDLYAHAIRSQEIISELVTANRCGMVQIALNGADAQLLSLIPDGALDLPKALSKQFCSKFRSRIIASHFAENDFWIENMQLLKELSNGCRIKEARPEKIEGSALFCNGERVEFSHLIIATGADPTLIPSQSPPFVLRKTQLAQTVIEISHAFHVMDTGLYMRPCAGGEDGLQACSLAGDGDEAFEWSVQDGSDFSATPAFMSHVANEMSMIFGKDAIDYKLTSHAAGVLRFSQTGKPFSGQVGDNRWLLTGFGADGLALAPSMAEDLVDSILN
jgi:glycine/D-amino acid oxidase-like deaminating enzyme